MKKAMFIFLVLVAPMLAFAASVGLISSLTRGMISPTANRAYRLSEVVHYDRDFEEWDMSSKNVYYYNSVNTARVDSVLTLLYNAMQREWIPIIIRRFNYNAAGRMINSTGHRIMGDLQTLIERTQSQYDNQDRLLHHYVYGMIMFGNREVYPLTRYHLNYTGDNLDSLIKWSYWVDSGYTHSSFTHDGAGRIIEELSQVSTDSISWTNKSMIFSAYHANDNSTGSSIVEWASINLPTMGMFGYTGPFAMITQNLGYRWIAGNWEIDERETYTWNSNNKLVTCQIDEMLGDWTPYYIERLLYDGNGNHIELLEQEYQGGDWVDQSKTGYVWQSFTANEDILSPAISSISLAAYPQPFASSVNINVISDKAGEVKLSIHNLKGQLITSFTGLPGSTLQWNGSDANGRPCANGIYFLRAEQGNSQAIQRIIKLK